MATLMVRWRRVVAGALIAFLGSIFLIVAVISGYAFKLGFEARGAPDPARINAFAGSVAPVLGPLSLALAVLLTGYWAARGAGSSSKQHGLLVGVLAIVPTLMFVRVPNLRALGNLALPVIAGWVGGWLAGRRTVNTPLQPGSPAGAA